MLRRKWTWTNSSVLFRIHREQTTLLRAKWTVSWSREPAHSCRKKTESISLLIWWTPNWSSKQSRNFQPGQARSSMTLCLHRKRSASSLKRREKRTELVKLEAFNSIRTTSSSLRPWTSLSSCQLTLQVLRELLARRTRTRMALIHLVQPISS